MELITQKAKALRVSAQSFLLDAKLGFALATIAPGMLIANSAHADTVGGDIRRVSTYVQSAGELLKLSAALVGLGMIGYGIYSYTILRAQDPREHSAGKSIGMMLGGGALASIGFLSSHLSESLFGTPQTTGIDDLGVGATR